MNVNFFSQGKNITNKQQVIKLLLGYKIKVENYLLLQQFCDPQTQKEMFLNYLINE